MINSGHRRGLVDIIPLTFGKGSSAEEYAANKSLCLLNVRNQTAIACSLNINPAVES